MKTLGKILRKTLGSSMMNGCSKQWFGHFASMLVAVVAFSIVSQARADGPFGPPVQDVPGITLTGLDTFQGKYLTVLYAHAWAPAIKTDNRQVLIQEVLKRVSTPITQTVIQVSPAQVAASGILSFNHVFLVVHDQPDFVWKNANDAAPQGPNNAFVALVVLNKGEIDELAKQQGTPQNITVHP